MSKKPRSLKPDGARIVERLLELLDISSPSGFTDAIVHHVCGQLSALGIKHELTRRGAIRATIPGHTQAPSRGIIAHLDTLGALVRRLKDNGRLELAMIGHWSARFAEGARVTLFTDSGRHRGTILPLKASGHVYNEEIDTQPVGWDHVELRIDEAVTDRAGLEALGVQIGDFVAIDPQPEVIDNGFIVSRHLDDKAGVAVLLELARLVTESDIELPVDCHLLFTISEEVGSGASAILHGDVAELVAIDNGTQAPGQASREYGVTVAMADQVGPFDFHLTRMLLDLARTHDIGHQRDVFRYYRCDAASAVEAGNDIRTALLTFGIDASHGYERIHLDALESLVRLLALYLQCPPVAARDAQPLGPATDFPFEAQEKLRE
jgi:peptidase M42 family hydrolase